MWEDFLYPLLCLLKYLYMVFVCVSEAGIPHYPFNLFFPASGYPSSESGTKLIMALLPGIIKD
ncbi:MAG: hypothetical protein LWY06_03645 [Firmicutes bacterium]|nr:hypothetical protein [Bacillota bacterium]